MIIVEMVKIFTDDKTFLTYPDQMINTFLVVHMLDPHIIGQGFDEGHELLHLLVGFGQEFGQRPFPTTLINPGVDLVVGL